MLFDRESLISDYVDVVVHKDMSLKDLMRIVGDQLEENLSGYSDDELINLIKSNHPEILN